MGAIEPWHLILLLAVVLVVVGPSRLPEVGKGLGQAMREFRNSTAEIRDAVRPEDATKGSTTPPDPDRATASVPSREDGGTGPASAG